MLESPAFDADRYLTAPISPRMGLALWCAACAIVERATIDPASIAAGLPVPARPFGENLEWRARLIEAFRAVRDRLAVAELPVARCTGEEYALHITISYAAMADTAHAGPVPEQFGLQLIPGPDDADFARAHADLFDDADLLMLFDPVMDGIEDPSSEVNQRLGIGPYLHPSYWFDTFPGYTEDADFVDESVILAANDLAVRSGARTFTVQRNGTTWEATAAYRGVVLTGIGDDPQTAATDLVRRIVRGGRCSHCAQDITLDPGAVGDGRCHWERHGPRWVRGCEEEE